VASYLVKPLTRREVLAAFAAAVNAASRRAPGEAAEEAPAPGRPASLRVLLAEDNLVNQALAAGLLKRDGHSVTLVADGRAAVAAAAEQPFDAILMDVQMPQMSGFEATAAIRSRERATGTRTRIIAMTAHAMQGDRDRCLAAGMDDYIAKPLKPGDLRRAIQATLS
jgi:two-component system sensor histidine kinase/response regulator